MMKRSVKTMALVVLSSLFISSQGCANEPKNEWITLGTMAGPIPNAVNSQPANAMIVNGNTYVVDAGDGTAGQLAKAGLSLKGVKAVFISHLHFDHTGGLPAILGLRWQTNTFSDLTVYGPPGTKATVEGIFQFMRIGTEGGYGVPGQVGKPASTNVNVVELGDGDTVTLEDFSVTAIRNTHYSWPENSEEWEKYIALSYKFDVDGTSVVYTGDTGESKALIALAKNADLLVSEMMDIDHTIDLVVKANPNMPEKVALGMRKHLSNHHVTPLQVGEMATQANVKKLVVTHMSPALLKPEHYQKYTSAVAEHYDGDITLAKDLDRFPIGK